MAKVKPFDFEGVRHYTLGLTLGDVRKIGAATDKVALVADVLSSKRVNADGHVWYDGPDDPYLSEMDFEDAVKLFEALVEAATSREKKG